MLTLKDIFEEVGSAEYGPWQYRAAVYDEDEDKYNIHRGVCFGTDYASAAKKVQVYFQYDLISLTLYSLETSPIYDFTDAYESEYDLFTITAYDKQNKF